MQGIKAGKVAKYVLLPEVIPRAKALFASGFGYVAFLMAMVYNSVRLIPHNHPYVLPENIGKFGIRHVVAEAANNLVLTKKNIDQIVVFMLLLAGLVILCLQFVLLIYAYIVQPAFAQSFFSTPDPTYDVAFMLLDNVFGVPDLFNSCVEQGVSCDPSNPSPASANSTGGVFPLPFHSALQAMFQFYSIGLLMIGVLIFLYFVVVVVAETATSGTPFGQRFQNVWVPVRLVVALGLLMPIHYGLNAGQFITLYTAKAGSGFATYGWKQFNDSLKTDMGVDRANPTGEKESLLALPSSPDITPIVQFMSLAHSCAYAYWKVEGHGVTASGYPNNSALLAHLTRPPRPAAKIKPYLVKNVYPWLTNLSPVQEVTAGTSYVNALNFYDNSDIIIRFGRTHENTSAEDEQSFKKYRGGVEPTCGEIRIPITDIAHIGQGNGGNNIGGANQIQEFYFNLIRQMWFDFTAPSSVIGAAQSGATLGVTAPSSVIGAAQGAILGVAAGGSADGKLVNLSHRYAEFALNKGADLNCSIGCGDNDLPSCNGANPACKTQPPDTEARTQLIRLYQSQFNSQIISAWNNFNQNSMDQKMTDDILERGWGGAGIWYSKIASMNGAFIGSVLNLPTVTTMPLLMEEVLTEKRAQDSHISGFDQYVPNQKDGVTVKGLTSDPLTMARVMSEVFMFWNAEGGNLIKSDKVVTGSAFENAMNLVLGLNGLFSMRRENAHIHPLAQLTAVGKGLVDSTIRNIGISTAAGFMGGMLGGTAPNAKGLGYMMVVFSDFMLSTAFVGLTAGLVLFYVLPFLPFVYFYFAVGSWLKTIFEAMVGVPLWALAHLRLDGEGLPGDAASNGYFLIFEIFLRPILTVFGLVAAMIIFTAQVRVLNFIWGLVVDNLAGAEADPVATSVLFSISVHRGVIDQFFYTVIYAIMVYMLATASFKLIDRIPDNILRWMGVGVSSFSDINQDPVEGLNKYAAIGGMTVGRQAAGGLQSFSKGTGAAAGRLGGMIGGG